jgi:hypothetical protein
MGYIDMQKREYSYGLVMDARFEKDMDGRIILLLDSGYKQSFWLSLDLLVELGELQVLRVGQWQDVRQ